VALAKMAGSARTLVRCEVFAAKVNGLLAGIASFEAEMMGLRGRKNLVTKNVHLMYNLF